MPSEEFSSRTESFLRGSLKRGYLNQLEDRYSHWLSSLNPPPARTVSQYADECGYLVTATGRSIRWKTREPQRAILDAYDNDRIEEIALLKSSRFGCTSMLQVAIQYFIEQDPSPIVGVQPRVKDYEEWSKESIRPMMADHPYLSQVVPKQKVGQTGNTIDYMEYPGGPLRLRASNSPDGFRRYSARVGLADEIDGYPLEAGPDGDVVSLLWTRLQDAWNRVMVLGSTPTEEDISLIWRHWLGSSKGFPFLICPHCGESHIRQFRAPEEPIILRGEEQRISVMEWIPGKPETAHYTCPSCPGKIEQRHHAEMLDGCFWIGDHWEYKGREYTFHDGFRGKIGFSTWAGYVVSPNTTPAKLVERWEIDSKDRNKKKVWVNTVEGRPWKEPGEELRSSSLILRKERFASEAPDGVLCITAGVDVGGSYWAIETVGWGAGERSWSVDYEVIPGDTSSDSDWDGILLPYLDEMYQHENGKRMPIFATAIDHGYNSKQVERFVHKIRRARVFAVKGMPGTSRPIIESDNRRARRIAKMRNDKFRPELMGDHQLKLLMLSRLRSADRSKPWYCHFPEGRGDEYFEELCNERLVTRYEHGRPVQEWIRMGNQEALDARKMAYVALLLSGFDLSKPAERPVAQRAKTKQQIAQSGGFGREGWGL